MGSCTKQQYNHPAHRGVILVVAILFSSVALAVGVGVYTRTYKELLLSSFWRESQIAFSAADAGLECALYWETHAPGSVDCFGNTGIPGWAPGTVTVGNPQTFSANVFPADPRHGCAVVTITQNATAPFTTIESRGQSDVCGSTNPRRVERGVKLQY